MWETIILIWTIQLEHYKIIHFLDVVMIIQYIRAQDTESEGHKDKSHMVMCMGVFVCVCAYAQSYLTLCNPMDRSPPGSSAHGTLQARILEQVAISSSRESSLPKDQTCISYVSCIGRWVLYYQCYLGSPHIGQNSEQMKQNVNSW